MSRIKPRIPGRYERPAALRGPLGDTATETGIRAGYAAGVAARTAVAKYRTSQARTGTVDTSPDETIEA